MPVVLVTHQGEDCASWKCTSSCLKPACASLCPALTMWSWLPKCTLDNPWVLEKQLLLIPLGQWPNGEFRQEANVSIWMPSIIYRFIAEQYVCPRHQTVFIFLGWGRRRGEGKGEGKRRREEGEVGKQNKQNFKYMEKLKWAWNWCLEGYS